MIISGTVCTHQEKIVKVILILMRKRKEQSPSLLHNICNEHYAMCVNEDKNLSYHWFVHISKSPRSFMFKPFMALAEINLNHFMGIMDDSERDGLIRLFDTSNFKDDLYIALASLEFYRTQRLEKFGLFRDYKDHYEAASLNYKEKIFTPEVMLSYAKYKYE
jgi:hypothetical protein